MLPFPPISFPSMTKATSEVSTSPTMGNCVALPTTSLETRFLPVESSSFKLPSPPPSWPSGGGFAKGIIDLGGLEVCQVSTFAKVWATHEGGQDDSGATFFVPSPIPTGFSVLGCYAQPNNRPLFGWVLVGRDTSCEGTLAKPVDYTLLWSSESSNIKQDGNGYFWLPAPPEGYKAVGLLVTNSSEKPSLDEVRCVRADLTDACEDEELIWDKDGFGVSGLRPAERGIQALGVWVGTFKAQANGSPGSSTVACLKNKDSNFDYSMPNLGQIQAIMQAYSPVIYLHPDEEFLPSSVSWFFDNGALLYEKGNPNPAPIASNGSNLPQGGSNDGAYWMDLPADESRQKDEVKKGDIPSSKVYLHVKPMLGATFTDIAIWIFYPFNGPAMAKVGPINLSLGRIGEHVSDWEHVTLRVSNFSGELWRVYFSEHSAGTWVEALQLEFEGGNKPVVYSSLHGHANYSKAGLVLEGNSTSGIGIRNDTAKGKNRMDTGERFEVVAAEYMGSAVTEPPWLNYEREWGPKITYDVAKEINKVAKLLPGKLKAALRKMVERLPDEVLGEEGPTGPKMKSNWYTDER